MENPSKESLQKLLRLIGELCEIEENHWFKESLASMLSVNYEFENFPEFLKHQKNQFRLKGKSFYESIGDVKLKKELVGDYIEMSWYQSINNLDRFMLFAFYQMENLLNHYITISNAYEKIDKNKDYYTHQYKSNFIVLVYDSFFYNNKKKSIDKINIWAKLTFWMKDSDNVKWEQLNHRNISNLISVRNANSHRNSNSKNEYVVNTIETLKKLDISSLGFYYNVLRKVLESYKDVNPNVKVYEVSTSKTKLQGPKQVGYVDLSKIKK
ncbi:hypothetical protein [Winogradskyella sp.]|uniref:hypothetical protein n=1 Tax=Winogradskyella sp. TaxID=1883156 RepID=UPI003AB2AAB1